MKVFFSLLTVVVLLVVAGLAPKALRARDRDYEDRLLGALTAVERTLAVSAVDAQGIGLYAPKLSAGAAADLWSIAGVLATTVVDGEATYTRFNARLRQTCGRLLDTACWDITGLVVNGETVAGTARPIGADALPSGPRG